MTRRDSRKISVHRTFVINETHYKRTHCRLKPVYSVKVVEQEVSTWSSNGVRHPLTNRDQSGVLPPPTYVARQHPQAIHHNSQWQLPTEQRENIMGLTINSSTRYWFFTVDSEFAILPQYLQNTLDTDDPTMTFQVVLSDLKPLLILHLKSPGEIALPSRRQAADDQIKSHMVNIIG